MVVAHWQVDLIAPYELTLKDRAAWLAMIAATPEFATPFLHPDYTQLVGTLRADTCIGLLRRGSELIGVFPHQRRPLRFARALGAPFSDGHALLTPDNVSIEGSNALRVMGLGAFRFTNLIDPHGCFAGHVEEMHETFLTWVDDQPGCTMAELREVHNAQAKKMRRFRRLVEQDFGGYRLEVDCRDRSMLDRLLTLKRAQLRRTGLHDVLASPQAQGLTDLLWNERSLGVRGQLSVLWFDARPAAFEFNLVAGDYMSGWLIAYEPDLQRYSPGMILAEELIDALPHQGVRIYDKGISFGRYKKYTSNTCGRRAAGTAYSDVCGGRLRASLAQAYRALEGGPASAPVPLATRVRRRFDHIMEAELAWSRRLGGLREALRPAEPAAVK